MRPKPLRTWRTGLAIPSLRLPLVASILVTLASPPLASQTSADTAAAVRVADTAVHGWLALVDKGQISESWDEAALTFQVAVTKAKWVQAVKQARGKRQDRKSTRLNSSHLVISYAVFCLKKKKTTGNPPPRDSRTCVRRRGP